VKIKFREFRLLLLLLPPPPPPPPVGPESFVCQFGIKNHKN
jgi:hypothetical protein